MDVVRANQPVHSAHIAAQVELLRELLVVEFLVRRESIEDRCVDVLVEILLQFSIRRNGAKIPPIQPAVQVCGDSVIVDVVVAV